MERQHTISIASEFSRHPRGRLRSDGPDSGERFRDEILVPALESGGTVTIDLEGLEACGGDFLEEAFGGLVRKKGYLAEDVKRCLRFRSGGNQRLVERIWNYVDDSRPAAGAA